MAEGIQWTWVTDLPAGQQARSWYRPARTEVSRTAWATLAPCERRMLLAHEYQHHARALFATRSQPLAQWRWLEARAERYAAQMLVPDAMIEAAWRDGCCTVGELSARWGYPWAWVYVRLTVYWAQQGRR